MTASSRPTRLDISRPGLAELALSSLNDTHSAFLRLPPELRNKIYHDILTDWTIYIVTDDSQHRSFPLKDTATRVPVRRHLARQGGGMHAALDAVEDRAHKYGRWAGTIRPLWRTCRRMYLETHGLLFSAANRFVVANHAHASDLAAALTPEQRGGFQRVLFCTGDALEATLRGGLFGRLARAEWIADAAQRFEDKFWSSPNKHIGEYYAFDGLMHAHRNGMARMPALCREYALDFTIELGESSSQLAAAAAAAGPDRQGQSQVESGLPPGFRLSPGSKVVDIHGNEVVVGYPSSSDTASDLGSTPAPRDPGEADADADAHEQQQEQDRGAAVSADGLDPWDDIDSDAFTDSSDAPGSDEDSTHVRQGYL